MAAAATALNGIIAGCRLSDFYTTPAVNGRDADYLNAVAFGYFDGEAAEFEATCKDTESRLGRTHSHQPGQPHIVEIDLDVVVFGGEVLRPVDFSRDYFRRGFNQLQEDCRRDAL